MSSSKKRLILGLLLFILFNSFCFADNSFIDKVYHPYVQPHEREFEFRWGIEKDNENIRQDNTQQYRLAYGQSLSENWFTELYLVGSKKSSHNLTLSALEVESLWQITEQGEYYADLGMLLEFEYERDIHIKEVSSALLIEKEWGRWVGTANLYLIYEWGSQIDNELETAMAVQTRYRWSRSLEPAIEFYSSDTSEGLGPVLLGDIKLSGKKKIHWEAGVIWALDNKTPDKTLKLSLEFEF